MYGNLQSYLSTTKLWNLQSYLSTTRLWNLQSYLSTTRLWNLQSYLSCKFLRTSTVFFTMFKSLKRSASVEADINLVRQLDNYDDLDQTTLETSEEQGPQVRGADGPWISPGESSDWLVLSVVFHHSF